MNQSDRFGKLVYLEQSNVDSKKAIFRCDCGNTKNISKSHVRAGNTVSCGCLSKNGKLRSQWKGCGDISGDFWYSHVLRSAKGDKQGNKVRKPKDINITIEYIWELFVFQERKCALTGLELFFPKKGKDRSYTASLDRINSDLGYVKGNVQWVHKHVNIMKNKFDQNYFIQMCKLIGGACSI